MNAFRQYHRQYFSCQSLTEIPGSWSTWSTTTVVKLQLMNHMALSLANQKQYALDLLSNITKLSTNDIYKWIYENKLKSSLIGVSVYMTIRFFLLKLRRRIYSYPPGPIGIPIFGFFLHTIIGNFILKLPRYGPNRLADYYGPICMRYSVGGVCIVNIADTKLAKKLLSLKANKGQSHILHRMTFKPNDVVVTSNSDGVQNFAFESDHDEWIGRRKLAQNALISMCTSTYISDIIDQIMYKTVFPELDKIIQNEGIYMSLSFPICFMYTKQIM